MPELGTMEKQKTAGFVNSKYNRSEARKKRIEQEEQELEEFIKQSRGEDESGDTGDNPSDGEAGVDSETKETKREAEEDEHSSEKETKGSKEEAEQEEELTSEEKSFKKRYGDLRRHFQKKEKEWKEQLEAAKSGKMEPPASEEDIKKWQEKYPQVAKIIETVAQKKAKEMFDKADSRLKDLDDFAYEAERERAMGEIKKVHEDFDELRESDEFHTWADEQPKWVQDALYENEDDPKSVIRVIDLYKSDKGLTKQARKTSEKQAASPVSTKSKPKVDADGASKKFRESQIAKMSIQEFEKKQDEIQEAMRSGNFIYDLSGGAR